MCYVRVMCHLSIYFFASSHIADTYAHKCVPSVLSNAPWPKPVYVKLNEINYLIKLMKSNYAFWTNTITRNNNFKLYPSVDAQPYIIYIVASM